MNAQSTPRLLRSLARVYGPKPAIGWLGPAGWTDFSWLDVQAAAWDSARLLVDSGFEPEQTAVIGCECSPHALTTELGVHAAAGIAFPIPEGYPHPSIVAILREPTTTAAFASEIWRERIAAAVAESGRDLPVRPIGLLEHRSDAAADQEGEDELLAPRIDRAGPDTPATLVVSPGTTGAPRLVDLRHANLTQLGEAAARRLGADMSDVWMPIGPHTHPFLMVTGFYAAMASAGQVVLAAEGDWLKAVWRGSPSIATCLASRLPVLSAQLQAESGAVTGLAGRMAGWAMKTDATGDPNGVVARLKRALGERYGLPRIRGIVGGRLRTLVAGWGAGDAMSHGVFGAVGVTVEGSYGLTDSAGLVSFTPTDAAPGSVGRPLDGIEVRIADDGELLVSGASVLFAYHGKSPLNTHTLVEGWLSTGDLGRIEPDGSIVLEGRKKGQSDV